jgi:hypothetical protein
MKAYIAPEMELIELLQADIVTVSGGNGNTDTPEVPGN